MGTFPGYIVKNSVPDTLGALTPDGPTIGSHNNLLGHDGLIDEVRISSVARSADWLKTFYNNQMWPDPDSGFYTVDGATLPLTYHPVPDIA